jgi:hypothetical protein
VTDHLTRDQRAAVSQQGADASATRSRAKRIAFWVREGVPYEIGLRIYNAGFQCAYQQRRRKEQREVRT